MCGGDFVPVWNNLLQSVVFVISLSTDAFAASIAYGAGGIRVPWRSAGIISAVCSTALAAALGVGSVLQRFFSPDALRWVCFVLLCGMGLLRLFDSALKNYIRRHQKLRLRFAANHLHFIFTVYADAETADADRSKVLSPAEAATLALALSLDSLAVGVGAALSGIGVLLPTVVSVVLTLGAVPLGCTLGERLQRALRFDLSYVSALLLIVLALARLLTTA